MVVEKQLLPRIELKTAYKKIVWLYVYRDFSGSAADRAAERICLRLGLTSYPQHRLFHPATLAPLADTGRTIASFLAAVERVKVRCDGSAGAAERIRRADTRAEELRRSGAIDAAQRALADEDLLVRLRAVEILAERAPAALVEPAAELLALPNDPLRFSLCQGLARAADARAAPALEETLGAPRASFNPNVLRIRAVEALATCGTPASIGAIAPHATSGDYRNGLTGCAIETLVAIAERYPAACEEVRAALVAAFPPPAERDGEKRACTALARRVHSALARLTGRALPFPQVYDQAARKELQAAWDADPAASAPTGPPYLAEGIKIGEVSQHSAIVWTRLCAEPAPDPSTYAIAGSSGQVKLIYRELAASAGSHESAWCAADPRRDYTHQFALQDLKPGTVYTLEVLARAEPGGEVSARLAGRFRTAYDPAVAADVRFVAVTGQGYHRRDDGPRGHAIYKSMLALAPDFFVHTGDIVYYDRRDPVARTIAQARAHWQRMYSLANQLAFHQRVASYFEKDDHDTLANDCWPGQRNGELRFADGQAIFREQVPMGTSTYRTVRWGRDLQIWLVEGRDFRSPNNLPDGPRKTIWGAKQIEWFERTMRASDATFRVLISPTPLVGPDRKSKRDNHANAAFAHEGRRLRRFLAEQKNSLVICGDRHWQYVSVDPETGLWEFCTGPTTDRHAGGFRLRDRSPAQRYLRIRGGFLEARVRRAGGRALLTVRHRDTAGRIQHEQVLEAPVDAGSGGKR